MSHRLVSCVTTATSRHSPMKPDSSPRRIVAVMVWRTSSIVSLGIVARVPTDRFRILAETAEPLRARGTGTHVSTQGPGALFRNRRSTRQT